MSLNRLAAGGARVARRLPGSLVFNFHIAFAFMGTRRRGLRCSLPDESRWQCTDNQRGLPIRFAADFATHVLDLQRMASCTRPLSAEGGRISRRLSFFAHSPPRTRFMRRRSGSAGPGRGQRQAASTGALGGDLGPWRVSFWSRDGGESWSNLAARTLLHGRAVSPLLDPFLAP